MSRKSSKNRFHFLKRAAIGQHKANPEPVPPSLYVRWWVANLLTAIAFTIAINTPLVAIIGERWSSLRNVPAACVVVGCTFMPFFADWYYRFINRILEGGSRVVLETYAFGDLMSRYRLRYMQILLISSAVGVPCLAGSAMMLDRAYSSWDRDKTNQQEERNRCDVLWSRTVDFVCMKSIDEGGIRDMKSLCREMDHVKNAGADNRFTAMQAINVAFTAFLADTSKVAFPIHCSQIAERISSDVGSGAEGSVTLLLKARLLLRSSQNGLHIASVNEADTLLANGSKRLTPSARADTIPLSHNDAMIAAAYSLYRGVVAKLQAQSIAAMPAGPGNALVFCYKISMAHRFYLSSLDIARKYSLGDLETKAENNISDLTFFVCNILLDDRRAFIVLNYKNEYAPITKVKIIDKVMGLQNTERTLNNRISSLRDAYQMKQSGVIMATWAQAECLMGKAKYRGAGGSGLDRGSKEYLEIRDHLLKALFLLDTAFVAFDETEVLDQPGLFYLDFLLSFSPEIRQKYNVIAQEARKRHGQQHVN